jgi:Flp pilus assembly pilin Flp
MRPNHQRKQQKQRGQSLIEFILLMLVITTMSVAMHRTISAGIGKIWLRIANQIVDNPSVSLSFD